MQLYVIITFLNSLVLGKNRGYVKVKRLKGHFGRIFIIGDFGL